jgi:hypothetical protein
VIWFNEDDLLRCVGGDRFDRAQPYVDEVGPLEVSSDEVVAMVGTGDEFRVRLTGADGQLIGECSCSDGRRGVFCVHCVAAGVMAVEVATPPDVEVLQSQVDALGEPRKLVGPSLHGWVKDAYFVLNDLDLGTYYSDPAAMQPLYQQVLWHLAHKTHWFETEEDYPELMRVKARVLEGLAMACQAAASGLDELAGWLADLRIDQADSATAVHLTEVVELFAAQGPGSDEETEETDDSPCRSPGSAAYRDVDEVRLFAPFRALNAYRRRLDELHRNLPVINSEDDEPESQASRCEKIRELREEFLRAFDPDVDTLVAFFAEDTSNPWRYISIAHELRSAGRFEEAISWLERADHRYRCDDLMAQLCTATGQHREAARHRWQEFETLPSKDNYVHLLAAAEQLNAVGYARKRAFNLLRQLDSRLASEAIPILMYEAELAIDERRDYRQAVQLLAELKQVCQFCDLNFTVVLANFKTKYERRPDVLKVLAESGL